MTKEQASHYNMDESVLGLVGKNPAQFLPEDEYLISKEALEIEVADLRNLLKTQDDLEQISADPKDVARETATLPLFQLACIVYSLGYATGNISLMEKVKITLSELKRLSDSKILFRFENFISAATEYLPALLPYGLTQETLDTDTTLVISFSEEVKKYNSLKKDHKEVTKQIKIQFRVVDKCLIPFDNMVENKRISDPVWYSLYWSTRAISYSPASHVSAKGKVFDAATRQALTGAIVNVYNASEGKSLSSGADLVKTVKVKSYGGGFNLKSLPTGTYIVTVTYAGYADQVVTIYVNEGNSTSFDLALSKLA